MAVAFDAAATADGTGTSLTYSHTCGGSATAILIGGEHWRDGGGADEFSGATYNAVSATALATIAHGIVNQERVKLFGLASPATGANNVVISTSASMVDIIGGSVSFTGTHATVPFGTASAIKGTDSGSGAVATQDISSATGDMVADVLGHYNLSPTIGAGQTAQVTNNNGAAAQSIHMSTEAGAATVTMSWTTAADSGHVAVNVIQAAAGGTAVVTGTATAAMTEANVVAGGKTLIITLTSDTFVAAGGDFDAIRQDLINGFDSAQAEATGWNAEVRDKAAVTEIVRTSDTIATWTIAAQAGHNITAQETITATIPASALVGAAPLVATPTFTVDPFVVYSFFRGMR